MTKREYLDKLHLYFFEHYDGTISSISTIKEKDGKIIMKFGVTNPHAFLDWWEAIYIPLDSWIHKYDANYEVSENEVIFTVKGN